MGYTDEWFNPPREFWGAMTEPAICPNCNYASNGSVRLWMLLDAPLDFECNKCHFQWSAAIPKDDCEMRERIKALIEAERKFYVLRSELNDVIHALHGRTDAV